MKSRISCLLLTTLLLAGCLQKSVNPFFTTRDIVAEPKLAGVWREPKDPNESGEDKRAFWEFADGDGKRFDLVIRSRDERHEYDAHVFKLGEERFLDIGAKVRAVSAVPAHHLFKLLELGPDLKLAPLNTDWVQKWLRQHPDSLAHVAVIDPEHRDDRDKDELVLTADTKTLQSFVRDHSNDENFFGDPTLLKRQSHDAIPGEKK